MNIPFLNSVSQTDKMLLASNLSLMLKSGLSLHESLIEVRDQTENKSFRKILDKVVAKIEGGRSLADSLAEHTDAFGSFYINIIQIGEESGRLRENLEHLAEQLEKTARLKRKIKAAMVYPGIILSSLIILIIALVYFVLPKIIPVFNTLNVELPFTTRILIKVNEITQAYGLFILLGFIVFLVLSYFISRISSVRFLLHKLILRLPVVSSLSKNTNVSSFSRTLGILIGSGLPIVKSLKIARKTTSNLVYKREIQKIAQEVEQGKNISGYLKSKSFLFPSIAAKTIGVGERTGNLEKTLLYVSDFYEEEVDKSVKTLSTVFEPALLIVIGLSVGFIALAILSPIYEITKGLNL